VVLARLAGVYDDLGHSPSLAGMICRIAERRLTSRCYPADTSRGQAFVHLEDAVSALTAAVEHRHELPAELSSARTRPSASHTKGSSCFGSFWISDVEGAEKLPVCRVSCGLP